MEPNTASIEMNEPEATVRVRALFTRPMPSPIRRGTEIDCSASEARKYLDLGWVELLDSAPVALPEAAGSLMPPLTSIPGDLRHDIEHPAEIPKPEGVALLEVSDFPSMGANAGVQVEQVEKPKRRKA